LTSADERPLTGFGYEEGGFPRQRVVGPYSATNLEGFGIVYSADADKSPNACEARAAAAADSPLQGTAVFEGRSLSEYGTEGAGMSQANVGRI